MTHEPPPTSPRPIGRALNLLVPSTLGTVVLFLLALGGGVFPWTVAVTAVTACLVQIAHAWKSGPRPRHEPRGLDIACLAVLVFLLLTLIPLPTALTRLHGRVRFEQNRQAAEILRQAADQDFIAAIRPAFTLTRNRAGTMRIVLLFATCFPCAFLAASLSERRKRGFLLWLCLLGGALAVAGSIALRVRPQGDTLWWVYRIPHTLPGPVLCFINRNHYAGYLAMLSPAALALCFGSLGRRRWIQAALTLAAFAAMTLAIVLTLSRGAAVAYAGGHAVLLGFYLVRRRWWPATAMIVVGCATGAGLLLYSGPNFRARMASLREPLAPGHFDERLDTWRTCVAIWRTYPVLGAGPNAFRMVFPQHRATSRREFPLHAENEYLQLLAEGGSVGVALAVLLLAACARAAARAAGSPERDPAVSAAVGAGLAAAALHACFDFAPHLPLYAVSAAALAGLRLGTPPAARESNPKMAWPSLLGLAAAAVLSYGLRPMHVMDSPPRMRNLDTRQLATAVIWAPTSWQTWFYFGRAVHAATPGPGAAFHERCATRAAELDPNNYLLWRELGRLRLGLGMNQEAAAAYARVKQLRSWVSVPNLPKEAPHAAP